MSHAAIDWAIRQDAGTMSARLALIVLAHHANAHGQAWPSLVTIAQSGGMDVRSARRAIAELQARGLIFDTGKRRGASGRVRIWRLAHAPAGIGQFCGNADNLSFDADSVSAGIN